MSALATIPVPLHEGVIRRKEIRKKNSPDRKPDLLGQIRVERDGKTVRLDFQVLMRPGFVSNAPPEASITIPVSVAAELAKKLIDAIVADEK